MSDTKLSIFPVINLIYIGLSSYDDTISNDKTRFYMLEEYFD